MPAVRASARRLARVSCSRQSPWIRWWSISDQLDVGRLGGGAEPLVAGRREHRRRSPSSLRKPASWLAAVGVAVDDHGPGAGLVGDEPGEDRDDPARAGERPPRVELDQGPRGGELDPAAGGREGLDQRVDAGRRPPGRSRSVTCPRAVDGRGGQVGLAVGDRRPERPRRARRARRPAPRRRRPTGRRPGTRRARRARPPSPAPG